MRRSGGKNSGRRSNDIFSHPSFNNFAQQARPRQTNLGSGMGLNYRTNFWNEWMELPSASSSAELYERLPPVQNRRLPQAFSYQSLPSGYIPPGTHSIPSGQLAAVAAARQAHHSRSRSFLSSSSKGGSRSREASVSSGGEEDNSPWPEPQPKSQSDYREVLPPIIEAEEERDHLNFDEQAVDRYAEGLASFPELAFDAHQRIFQMGNDIVDCFEVELQRYFRGQLFDSERDCVAVFTKKDRTGQRWLMVFQDEGPTRGSAIRFNRLLTHSLTVNIKSPVSIEIEAGRGVQLINGLPAEVCVLKFRNTEEATRFYRTLNESQSTSWNHHEVTHEQRLKNLYQKVKTALSDTEMLMASLPLSQQQLQKHPNQQARPLTPSPRTPFTLASLNLPLAARARPSTTSCSAPPLSDLDQDWRNNGPRKLEAAVARLSSKTKALANGSGDKLYKVSSSKSSSSSDIAIVYELEDAKVLINNPTMAGQIGCGYELLGSGKLQLLSRGKDVMDELQLVSKTGAVIFQHFLFKWNSLAVKISSSGEGDGPIICYWKGAASFPQDGNTVPENRKFCLSLHNKDEVQRLSRAFKKGVDKAKNHSVTKSHLQWFMKNRGDPQATPPNSSSDGTIPASISNPAILIKTN